MRLTAAMRLLAVLLLAVLTAGCGKGNKNITKANFEKIKPGMTVSEVEALLGRGEDEADLSLGEGSSVAGSAGIGGDFDSVAKPKSSTRWRKWGSDTKFIRVGFDNERATAGKITQQGL
jgi:hypothetical protein